MAHMSASPRASFITPPRIVWLARRCARPAASCAVIVTVMAAPVAAQPAEQTASPQDDPTLRFRVPTVTVTAQKEPEDKQKVPVSVTAVSRDTIEGAAIHIVSDA